MEHAITITAPDHIGSQCPSGQRCPGIGFKKPTICKDKGFDGITKLPGERAFNSTDCASGKMESSYCVGLSRAWLVSAPSTAMSA